MSTLALVLLVLAGVLLLFGLLALFTAPILAARVASTVSRPRLARRASGPDRMRALISAQRAERQKRTSLSGTLVRAGAALAAAALLSLIGAVAAFLGGY